MQQGIALDAPAEIIMIDIDDNRLQMSFPLRRDGSDQQQGREGS
jgi:hypothetical protein